jgi:L-alanine-DL-glutamate epimerase-like enolase superfamily enzyme
MRVTKAEDLHADGGWRNFSFLKLSTDESLVGWAEYNETSWNAGLTGVIRALAKSLIGKDPTAFGKISGELRAQTRMTPGGLNDQAIATIENACIDLAAKAAGVPACALFGGPYRERLKLYWSHCGSFRAAQSEIFERVLKTPPLKTLKDVAALGKEVVARGYKALKTNPLVFGADGPRMLNPGFRAGLDFARGGSTKVFGAIVDQLNAFRDGTGPDIDIQLDVNFGFRPEALRQLGHALDSLGLAWLEADMHEPKALARVRDLIRTPIASLESIHGAANYRPYLEAGAVDVAIIDVVWNGFLESVRAANLADTFEINVAPHNFYGHLASAMSAQFCAAVPNFRIMEYEVDDVPWKDDLVTHAPEVRDGELILSMRPGWGTDVNEEAVRAHPAKGQR